MSIENLAENLVAFHAPAMVHARFRPLFLAAKPAGREEGRVGVFQSQSIRESNLKRLAAQRLGIQSAQRMAGESPAIASSRSRKPVKELAS